MVTLLFALLVWFHKHLSLQHELLGAEMQLCQLHHLQICPNEIWREWSKLLQTKWNCHMFLTAEMTVQRISHSSGWHASLDLQNGKEKPVLEATVLWAFTLFFHFPWNSNKLEAFKEQWWTDMACQLPKKKAVKIKNPKYCWWYFALFLKKKQKQKRCCI